MRRLIAGSVPGHRAADGTAKCPESLCPMPTLSSLGRPVAPPRRTLLLRLRSYGLMRQSRMALLYFSLSLVRGVFAGSYQPLLPSGPSRRYSAKSFLRCPVPYSGGSAECLCLFLPLRHRPSPILKWVGFPLNPLNDFSTEVFFEAADIPLCSGLPVCSPPRSFLPLPNIRQSSQGFYRPS